MLCAMIVCVCVCLCVEFPVGINRCPFKEVHCCQKSIVRVCNSCVCVCVCVCVCACVCVCVCVCGELLHSATSALRLHAYKHGDFALGGGGRGPRGSK